MNFWTGLFVYIFTMPIDMIGEYIIRWIHREITWQEMGKVYAGFYIRGSWLS